MGVLRNCNKCGHTQMVGYNKGDGRVKWWSKCEECKEGNFMARISPDPRISKLIRERKNVQ